jgi:hypothetical protein
MALSNPYAKKRPRSTNINNDNEESATRSSSSWVYRPSTSIKQGTYTTNSSYGVTTTSTGGSSGGIRNTYQPSTRLVGSNVVSDRDCAALAEPPNIISTKAVTTIGNEQKRLDHSFNCMNTTTTSSRPRSCASTVNMMNANLKQIMTNPALNSSSAIGTIGPAVETVSNPAPIQKPSPNPYLKKQKQYHPSNKQRMSQASVMKRPSPQHSSSINHAVTSMNLPEFPLAVGKPSSRRIVGIAYLRPESWTATSNATGTQINTVTSSVKATPTISHEAHLPSQQQHTQQQETPMDGLPSELFYSSEDVKPINDAYRLKLIQNAQLSSPLLNGWILYPHQKKAVVRSLTMRRMILALDMGLGKTCIGAVWSMAFKRTYEKLKIFVICPVSLKEEWKRTAQEKVGLQVEEETSGKKKTKKKSTTGALSKQEADDDDDDCDNDDGLKLRICSWAKIPTEVESHVKHFVVCCDEAHSMQSTQAQRTRDILTLVEDKR